MSSEIYPVTRLGAVLHGTLAYKFHCLRRGRPVETARRDELFLEFNLVAHWHPLKIIILERHEESSLVTTLKLLIELAWWLASGWR